MGIRHLDSFLVPGSASAVAFTVFSELFGSDSGFLTIHQPQRIYYWLAFLFGLLTDADTGAVFGQHALTYCMVVFFTELMSVRLSWLSSIAQSISLIPIFYIPAILLTIEAFCFGNGFGPWSVFAQGLLSVVFWPAWCWLLARRWVPNYGA